MDRTQYDFQYEDKEGYKMTMGGLSRSFDKEFWNYAKLISGVLTPWYAAYIMWLI